MTSSQPNSGTTPSASDSPASSAVLAAPAAASPEVPRTQTQTGPLMPARGRLATTIAVGLSFFVATLDITVVIVALPAMARDLNATLDQSQWVVNAYTLTFASVLLAAGALSDKLGRRPLFVMGHVLFGATSAACMLATSSVMLIVARGVQGLGAAFIVGISMALISDAFQGCPPMDRRKAVAGASVMGAVAMGLGPIIGGAIIDFAGGLGANTGWPWIFALNLPTGVTVIVLITVFVPDVSAQIRDSGRAVPLDIVALLGTIIGLYALNYAIVTGTKVGWGSPVILGTLVAGIVILAAIAYRQVRRGEDAMIDPALFRIPTFNAALLIGLFMRMFSFGFLPFMIFWVTGVAKASPFHTGIVLMAMSIPTLLAAGPAAKAGKKHAISRIVGVGLIVAGVGLALLVLLAWSHTLMALIPGLLVLGIGSGIMMPFMMDLVIAVTPPHKAGVATGVANAAMPLGTSLGVAMWGALLSIFVYARIPGQLQEFAGAGAQIVAQARALVQVGNIDGVAALPGLGADAATAAAGVLSQGVALMSIIVAIPALAASMVAFKMIRPEDNWVKN